MPAFVVDIHAHYVPRLVFERFEARRRDFPGVSMERAAAPAKGWRFRFVGGEPTRPVVPGLSDLDARLSWMRAERVDHQILSLWTDLEGYELPPEQGLAWSRFVNECMLEELRATPQFTPLASAPLQDGRLAAEVLREALDAGFAGAMIGTLPGGARGGDLDDPQLDPFWDEASRLGAAIYLHPMFLCNEPRLRGPDLVNIVGRLVDTTIAVGRLIASGHLLKFPGVKLILSHGGAALPIAMGRFRRVIDPAAPGAPDPQKVFDALYFDSCVYDAPTLEFLVARASAERVMLGTDAPMSLQERHPVAFIESASLSQSAREAVLGGNARRVFRLRADCGCGRD